MKRIIISRTDSIGDVVLTLPLAAALKKAIDGAHIIFLGQAYTKAVINSCPAVDRFADIAEFMAPGGKRNFSEFKADVILHVFPQSRIARLAKTAGIPLRVGTSHRIYHWWTCTKLLNLGRKNSDLHEAQLNLKLGVPLGIKPDFNLEEISGMTLLRPGAEPGSMGSLIDTSKINVILHPTSKGSAREWGLDNFSALIKMLSPERFNVFVSGTADDGRRLAHFLEAHPEVTSICGLLELEQFIAFISRCDALVAASTGPLHLAAALGKHAIGIYAPMRPIHKERWGPIGKNAIALDTGISCSRCRKTMDCDCIRKVNPAEVAAILSAIRK